MFKENQEVICVNNLEMESVLVVGEKYKVQQYISLMNGDLVYLVDMKIQFIPRRFIEVGHPNQEKIIALYNEIRLLDQNIEETFNIEHMTGVDHFWERENLRGQIDNLEETINELRNHK
ncbi:hypothetical protein ASwh1_342 [Aeromonas phage Aswh_1]|nr:hypothetical protein ASwh1_342 [Aeromonas phage Aswh_1]